MGTFKKTTVTKGQFKNISATGDGFMDDETGELINLSKILHEIYEDNSFELSTSLKADEPIE